MNQQDDELDAMLKARQYICPICKKKFSIPLYVSTSKWVYMVSIYDRKEKKRLQKKCCSYSCYRKGQQ
jgi:hypothetical protein